MPRSVIADAFSHHMWATLRLLDTCAPLDEEALARSTTGTYGSIIDTLRHLVGGDSGYLYTLTGGAVALIDEESMDVSDLRGVMEGNGDQWTALLAEDLDPDTVVVRSRPDSETHATLGIRLAQALHHGSDHRSQVCTILTTIGVEPPAIDVWDFAWEHGTLTEVER